MGKTDQQGYMGYIAYDNMTHMDLLKSFGVVLEVVFKGLQTQTFLTFEQRNIGRRTTLEAPISPTVLWCNG